MSIMKSLIRWLKGLNENERFCLILAAMWVISLLSIMSWAVYRMYKVGTSETITLNKAEWECTETEHQYVPVTINGVVTLQYFSNCVKMERIAL